MMRNMAKALNKGIAHLLSGGSVEDYMEQAGVKHLPASSQEELETLLSTATALLPLRQMPIPAPRAKAAHRAQFLSEAVRLKEERRTGAAWGWLRFPARAWRGLWGAALALALLLAVGASAVNAAASSLPGSALYPLKLAIEDTRLALAFHPPTRAQLFLQYARERTEEMMRLAVAGHPVDERVVQRMAEEWHGAVQAAASSGREQGPVLLQQVIETSARQKEVLHQASAQAPPEAQAVFETAIVVTEEAAREAQEALQNLVATVATPTNVGGNAPLPTTPTPTAIEVNAPQPVTPTPTSVGANAPLPVTP
ncbi:MAG: hypothetical protein H5T63_02790, partial [Chloroflexi bacterium]|nr:hypothetical protein [Chloroflexota bacterium]